MGSRHLAPTVLHPGPRNTDADLQVKLSSMFLTRHALCVLVALGVLMVLALMVDLISGSLGAKLSVLKFQRYVFNLDQFAGPARETQLDTSERYLPELLWPKSADRLDELLKERIP